MRPQNRRRLPTIAGDPRLDDESLVPVGYGQERVTRSIHLPRRYHQSNHSRIGDLQLAPDKEVYASSNEYRLPQRVSISNRFDEKERLQHVAPFLSVKGWLIDFINRFGDLGGFDKILARILSTESKLTISVVVALLKPWGLCYEYLTQATVKKYFAPIIVRNRRHSPPSFSRARSRNSSLNSWTN